jgi:hypothetical protein
MRSTHAHARAVERLGIVPDANLGWWFPHLLKIIRDGGAKLVQFGHDGKLAYDVPTDTKVYRGTVRVLVTADKNFVITVLPTTSKIEHARQRLRQRREAEGQRRREFHRIEENDDENGF